MPKNIKENKFIERLNLIKVIKKKNIANKILDDYIFYILS